VEVLDADPYLDLLKKCLTASLYDESTWYVFQAGGNRNKGLSRKSQPAKDLLRKGVVRFLARQSMMLVKRVPYDPQKRENGRDWPYFGYSMAGLRRLDNRVLPAGLPESFRLIC
jgi:hypothetical protein